jgi:hypothetical protein
MAARFITKPPTNAATTVPRPVVVSAALKGTLKPKEFIIAMPGMFCDAIATKYSGKAIVKMEARLKLGWTKFTDTNQSAADTDSPWFIPISVNASTIATGDAQSGASQ